MIKSIHRRVRLACLIPVLLVGLAGVVPATNSLSWHKAENRVDADLRDLPLGKMLEQIAADTGWQVYTEPGTQAMASSKFKNLPVNDALRRLLGDLNFALLPETNGATRLLVFKTSILKATQRITPLVAPKSSTLKPIADELIVRLKPGANIDEWAKKLGAKVTGRIDSLNAYRLKFDDAADADAARSTLASNGDVTSVESNFSIERPPDPQPMPGFPGGTPSLQLKPPGPNGRLIVGLVDTALQSLGPNLDAFLLKSISLAGAAQPDPTTPTHATMMYETLVTGINASANGGGTSAQVVHVDVYGNSQQTSTWDIGQGIVQAINNGANIVNVSSGATADPSYMTSASWFYDLVSQAHDKGIPILASAGNTPDNKPVLPAALPFVIAVTASDGRGNIANYANYADYVKLMAPGTIVLNYQGQAFVVAGTSVSSAFATGFATGAAESRNASLTAVTSAMEKSPSFTPVLPKSSTGH